MKARKFLALVMIMSLLMSGEAYAFKISNSTKKGIGKLLNKVVDEGSKAYQAHEERKAEEARAKQTPNTVVVNNNTTNNVNIDNSTRINQTQMIQQNNINTPPGQPMRIRARMRAR